MDLFVADPDEFGDEDLMMDDALSEPQVLAMLEMVESRFYS